MSEHLKLLRIVMPHFVCGILVDEQGRVREAAPIMRWSLGKTIEQIEEWVYRKGGSFS